MHIAPKLFSRNLETFDLEFQGNLSSLLVIAGGSRTKEY